MPRQFWSLANQGSYTDLYILTEIASEESWWTDVETPRHFKRMLDGIQGELHVWLSSPGGDAFAGNAIYDMLRAYSASGRGKTVAMVSLAASAASIIAMACDEIRISVLGTIMIHEPWSAPVGRASVLRATADVLDTIRDAQVDAYMARTGRSREEILSLLEGSDGNGTYMNANMAIEMGFADTLIDGEGGADAQSFARSLSEARVRSAIRSAASLIETAAGRVAAASANGAPANGAPRAEGDGDAGDPEGGAPAPAGDPAPAPAPAAEPEGDAEEPPVDPEIAPSEVDELRSALLRTCLTTY